MFSKPLTLLILHLDVQLNINLSIYRLAGYNGFLNIRMVERQTALHVWSGTSIRTAINTAKTSAFSRAVILKAVCRIIYAFGKDRRHVS